MLDGVPQRRLERVLGFAEQALGELDVGEREGAAHEVGEVVAPLEARDRFGVAVACRVEIPTAPVRQPQQRGGGAALEEIGVPGEVERHGWRGGSSRRCRPARSASAARYIARHRGDAGVLVLVEHDGRLVAVEPRLGELEQLFDPGRVAGRHAGTHQDDAEHGTVDEEVLGKVLEPALGAAPPVAPGASPGRRVRSAPPRGPGHRRPWRARWPPADHRSRRTSRSPDGAAAARGRGARRGAGRAAPRRRGGGSGTRCGGRRARRGTGSIGRAPRGSPWLRPGRSRPRRAGRSAD